MSSEHLTLQDGELRRNAAYALGLSCFELERAFKKVVKGL